VTASGELIDADAREAIRTRLDASLCVEAGAGTGKTTVLVDRIVEILGRGGARIDEIAVITFTDKAAAELSARVRQRLEESARDAESEEVRTRLEAALDGLHRAHVQTIHAFATSLLRERPVEARIDPGFEVLDRLEAEIDFDRAYGEWLGELLAVPGSGLDRAVNRGLLLRELRQAAVALERHRHLIPLERIAAPTPDLGGMLDWLAEACADLERLGPTCTHEEDRAFLQIAGVLEFERRCRDAASDPERLERLVLHRAPSVSPTVGRKDNWSDGACDHVRAIFRELKERLEAGQRELRIEALADVLPVVEGFVSGYADERRRAGRATYDDLLIRARDRVRDDPEVRAYFQRRFRRILVDEFQDTDPVQAELVAWLASDGSVEAEAMANGTGDPDWRALSPVAGKLVVVGDPKQSIYRFRRADIAVYDEFKGGPLRGEVLRIAQNFRSLTGVLDWVNGVFERVFEPEEGVQPEHVALVPGSRVAGPEAPTVVSLPVEPRHTATEVREAEARTLAAFLSKTVGDQRWGVRVPGSEAGEVRPARWRDVAVLFPWRTGIEAWEQAFAAAGIPCRNEGGRGFYQRQEVRDLVAVLLALDDPGDRISLVTALRSSACGASDEDLFAFVSSGGVLDYRAGGGGGSPTAPGDQGVLEGLDANGHAPPAAVVEGLETLWSLHRERRGLSLPELVRRVLERTRMVEVALALPSGSQAAANLLKVAEQSRGFAATGGRGLRAFAQWLAGQRDEDQAPEEEAPVADEGDDVVRFLTIHAAKGLEFPIVALANLGTKQPVRREPLADPRGNRLHLRAGSGRDGHFATPGFEDAWVTETRLIEAERMRWLYVALTRARDRLIVPVAETTQGGRAAPLVDALRASLPGEDAEPGTTSGGVLAFDVSTLEGRDEPPPTTDIEVDPAAVEAAGRARDAWEQDRDELLRRASLERVMTTASDPSKSRERPLTAALSEVDESVVLPTGGPAAEVGDALHQVMEHLDPTDRSGLETLASAACAEHGLGRPQVGEVVAMARRCLESMAPRRALAAGARHREVPYMVCGPDGSFASGRIDLLFREGEDLVVVDYKTDAVSADDAPVAAERHRGQADAYAAALRQTTGMTVREVVFVFARPGVEVTLRV